MYRIVDVEKFINNLGPAKCDYHKLDDSISYGLPLYRIIQIALNSMDLSVESWGNTDEMLRLMIQELRKTKHIVKEGEFCFNCFSSNVITEITTKDKKKIGVCEKQDCIDISNDKYFPRGL